MLNLSLIVLTPRLRRFTPDLTLQTNTTNENTLAGAGKPPDGKNVEVRIILK